MAVRCPIHFDSRNARPYLYRLAERLPIRIGADAQWNTIRVTTIEEETWRKGRVATAHILTSLDFERLNFAREQNSAVRACDFEDRLALSIVAAIRQFL